MADFNINVTGNIADNAVTNAKAANMATRRIKGRATAGTGDPEDLTADEASDILDSASNAFIRSSQSATNIANAVAAEAALRASGDTATLSAAQSHANGKVSDSISDGVTTVAPSQNAVFDALALKADATSASNASNLTSGTLPNARLDAELQVLAGLTFEADKIIQTTGASAAQMVDLKFGSGTYGGTITWTAGAAPTGTTNHSYYFEQTGNRVAWQINLTFATAGTTVTNVVLTLPTQFPTPAIPAGFTGANARLWNCDMTRLLSTPTGTLTNGNSFFIVRNAADNGFDIASTATFSSGTYRTFIFSGTYFTA